MANYSALHYSEKARKSAENASNSVASINNIKQEVIDAKNNAISEINKKTNVVDLTSNQTITGNKTFSGNTTLSGLTAGSTTLSGLNVTGNATISGLKTNGDIIRNINIDVTTSPTNPIYILPWKVENSEQSILAYQQIAHFKDGTITNSHGLRRTVNGSNILNSIEIIIDSNGNKSVNVITPETTSNSKNIATTEWVRNQLSSSGNGLATLISNANGNAIKFSNGLTIQWGSYEQTGNNSVTFPTAFNSTNYTISICGLQDVTSSSTGANISDNAIRSKTTTGFISNHLNRNRTNMYLVIGY